MTVGGAPISTAERIKLIAVWLIVALPLGWGVGRTFVNALKLFR